MHLDEHVDRDIERDDRGRRDASPPSVSAAPDRGRTRTAGTTTGSRSGSPAPTGRPVSPPARRRVQRARQGRRLRLRHVHERRRAHPEARRSGSSTTGPPAVEVKAEPATGRERLVQPRGRGRLRRLRHRLRRRLVRCTRPVQGARHREDVADGNCRDKAANTSQPAGLELRYDTKPPSLARVKAEIGSRGIMLRWTASKDALSFAVVRRPGLKGSKPSTVYDGKARTFTDRRLERGTRYRYTVTAYDQAGNGSVKALVAQASQSVTNTARTTPARATPALATPAPTRASRRRRCSRGRRCRRRRTTTCSSSTRAGRSSRPGRGIRSSACRSHGRTTDARTRCARGATAGSCGPDSTRSPRTTTESSSDRGTSSSSDRSSRARMRERPRFAGPLPTSDVVATRRARRRWC